ncbi:acyltransferase [Collinsella sp. HCP28S3_E12]|uniref:acyltransferase n=1 Tax=Collinsella sp. HCP28S3_E12 TaxID=3438921 RepID=UPI003F8AD7A8
MSKLAKLLQTSVIKTLRFNLHYFGWGGVRLPVLVSRNYAFTQLRGRVVVLNPRTGCILLGYSGVGIFDTHFDRGIWQCAGEAIFEGKASFGQGSKISIGTNGLMYVGNLFRNTAKGEFVCHDQMRLGAGTLVSWDTLLMDTDFHQIDRKPASAPVILGDNVWVGCRCMVLKGASVPNGSVLAAGSTVTKALTPERSLFGGVNKLLRTGIEWNE